MAEQFLKPKTGLMLNSGMVCCKGFMPESRVDNEVQKNKKALSAQDRGSGYLNSRCLLKKKTIF